MKKDSSMAESQPPLLRRGRRIPELDGFRGIAVLMVVAGHYCQYNVPSPQCVRIGITLSSLGVLLFFVLSGFLITALLLQEKDETGRIHFRRFYARRALRLGPALLLFLLTVVVLIYLGFVTDVPRYEIFASLFYARYLVGKSETLAHLWSLSLEEQFYLCWPLLLILMLRKSSRSSMLYWVVLGITISVALRLFLTFSPADYLYNNPECLSIGRTDVTSFQTSRRCNGMSKLNA